MRFIFGIVSAVLLSISICGCTSLKKKGSSKKKGKEKPKPEAAQTEVIGIIEMVNPEQNYVLVRCDRIQAVSPGSEIYSVDAAGVQSKLVVTPERKGYYLTADIKSGSPAVANQVLYRRPVAPTPPLPGATPSASVPSVPAASSPQEASKSQLPVPAEATPPPAAPIEPPTTPTLEPVVR